MSEPLVCCVCLTKDRPEMLRRAVASFRAQTYENKRLLIWDSAEGVTLYEGGDSYRGGEGIVRICCPSHATIGALRNSANSHAGRQEADIIAHWDDDDLSHPQRLTEQVALLQASGADCVGYSDMLFWDTRIQLTESFAAAIHSGHPTLVRGAAWLYLGPQKALGTSLMYWRRTWEAKPFPDQPTPGFATGEDVTWIKGLKLETRGSIPADCGCRDRFRSYGSLLHRTDCQKGVPRMIACIHGRNTSGNYGLMEGSDSWRRVAEWDSYCRGVMSL